MAKEVLTARGIQTAAAGDHADGSGLFLRVGPGGASWVFRFTAPDGRRREMGLGPANRSTMASCGATATAAREAADNARALLARRMDPIEDRKADRAAKAAARAAKAAAALAERTTLARHARKYHAETIEPMGTTKHAAQWIASLELNVPAALWNAPIDSIEAPALLTALAALQMRVPVTAARVRQRLEAVFDDAVFNKLCAANPAQILRKRLSKMPKGRKKGQFAALPFVDVPGFVRALRQQPGTGARALEFALLTASRTGEVLGCQLDEIDAQSGTWHVPAERMKGGEEHLVFLPPRALEIVAEMREQQGTYLFPSPMDSKKPLSNMAMLTVLRRMKVADRTTVHGLCRATFSTWANEFGIGRPDVIEACLAHREQDKVRKAYNRASFNAERRDLLIAWASYCNGEPVKATAPAPASTVVRFEAMQARAA